MTQMTRSELGAATRFINIGSAAALDNLGAMTVIAYTRFTAAPSATGYMFSKGPSAAQWDRFLVNALGAISFGRNSTGTANSPTKTSNTGLLNTSGTYQHLQATTDGTLLASGINLYIDAGASLAASASADGTVALPDNSAENVFLINRNGLDREFTGAAGYIAAWNRVLSDAERTTVRTVGPLAVTSGLLFCWANEQDYGPGAYTATRSTFVDGGVPTFADLGDSTAVSFTGAAPVEDLTASGTFVVPVSFTGAAPVDDLSAAGSFVAAGATVSFTGAAAVEDLSAAGSFVASTAGTFTSDEIYNNVGGTITLAATVGVDYFDLIHATNLTTVVRKTGLSTNASGIVTFTDAAVFPGVSYRADFKLANGTRIMPVKAAT